MRLGLYMLRKSFPDMNLLTKTGSPRPLYLKLSVILSSDMDKLKASEH